MRNILFISDQIKKLKEAYGEQIEDQIQDKIVEVIDGLDPKKDQVITSMSWGPEYWAAEYAAKKGIQYHVFLPFENQEKVWSAKSREIYNNLLLEAKSVTYLDKGDYSLDKIRAKEAAILEKADVIYHMCGKYVKMPEGKIIIKMIDNGNNQPTKANSQNNVPTSSKEGFFDL